jgi:hypothetical protein
MKGKLFSICIIVLLALCSTAWAFDVNGKWVAKVAGAQGQQDYEVTLTFKAKGTTLTGTLNNSSMPGDIAINDGKIEGDNISFSIIRSMGQSDMKIIWKGTVSGDEIKFTRNAEGGMGGQGGGTAGAGAAAEIIAKRAK